MIYLVKYREFCGEVSSMKKENTIAIRPLQPEDAAFLCSIFKDNKEYYEIFFDSANTLSEWCNRVIRFLSQNVVSHYIIEANSVPVGWISFSDTDAAERELCILVINKENLRCGYGKQCLSWLIEKSKAEGNRNFGFIIFAEEIVPECNEAVNLAQYRMRLSLA